MDRYLDIGTDIQPTFDRQRVRQYVVFGNTLNLNEQKIRILLRVENFPSIIDFEGFRISSCPSIMK